MVKRHAAWLVLGAVAVLAIVLALCGAVAHAQGAEAPPVVVAYPFDLNAMVWGGGSAGAIGGAGFLGWLLVKRLGLRVRRIEIDTTSENEATAPPPTAEVLKLSPGVDLLRADVAALTAALSELRADVASLSATVAHNRGTSSRIEARQEGLSQTANQIMLMLAERGGR